MFARKGSTTLGFKPPFCAVSGDPSSKKKIVQGKEAMKLLKLKDAILLE
jgi:hypothetical protein